MTSDARYAAVARARQGGFSTVALPGAAQYAGAGTGESVVIYWTESGPVSSVEGLIFELVESSSLDNYETDSVFGQTAARIPYADFSSGDGGVDFTANNLNEYVGNFDGDFTVELYGNALDADRGTNEFRQVGFSIILQSPDDKTLILSLGSSSDYTPRKWAWECATDTLSNSHIVNSNQGPRHISFQRQGQAAIFHYNGQQINSWDTGNTLPTGWDLADVSVLIGLVAIDGTITGLSDAILGQIRFTPGQAIYGTGDYAPPTEAFYVPPS